MLISLIIILLITIGGTFLTYLYEKEDSLLVRLAAGNVIGSAFFGLIAFLMACLVGFSTTMIVVSSLILVLPILLLTKKNILEQFQASWLDWLTFKGRTSREQYWTFQLFSLSITIVALILDNILRLNFASHGYGSVYLFCFLISLSLNLSISVRRLHDIDKSGWYLLVSLIPVIGGILFLIFMITKGDVRKNKYGANPNLNKTNNKFEFINFKTFLKFLYYLLIFLILCLFFDRAMFENKDGIFTGASNNLGDLPFHLGAIFSFTDGSNFPPENPSFAGAKFTYPFLVDFIVACLMKLGSSVRDAIFIQNITLIFSLVVLLEKFTFALTKNRLAGKLAPVIFLLSGGLGFVLFFRDYWQDGRSIFEYIWNLEKDYTIKNELLRWGNSLIVLFITQRGFLLGMPIVLIVLNYLWKIFNAEDTEEANLVSRPPSLVPVFFIGLLAGTLPLIHVHSLFVLFIVSAFLFFLRLEKWREWLIFGAGVSLVAVPELIWSLTGSASNLSKFIGWHWGWDKGEYNFLLFWAANLGLFIPLLFLGVFFIVKGDSKKDELPAANYQLLKFYLPFAFIFILSNTFKLAPWEWDNIKVLIYWFVASVPFAAYFLAYFWEKSVFSKITVILSLIILTLSGGLDVWRTISKQIDYQVFSRDAVKIAEEIKQKTTPKALFLNAPTYNSAVVLTGRPSFMRYIGHLSSYGIDYEPRENEVKRIYEGSAMANGFLQKNNIEYVIISPEEESYFKQNNLILNDEFFAKYPKIAEAGEYKVYKVK